MTLDDILDFLKGLVPGYTAIELVVAPPFGSDMNDYGQCRARCMTSPDPAAELACKTCIDAIYRSAVVKVMPELGGNVAGLALGAALEVCKKAIIAWAEKKGLIFLTGSLVPVVGWIFIAGEIANMLAILLTVRKCANAAERAKDHFCKCA